jgi:hypothetical protein
MLVVSHNQSKQVRGQIVPPAPAEQLRFLTNIQRLLAEGIFTATYKYALLAVLADLSVELGDESGSTLRLPTFIIAEKLLSITGIVQSRLTTALVDQLPCDLPCTNRIAPRNRSK